MSESQIILTGTNIGFAELEALDSDDVVVTLDDAARTRMRASVATVRKAVKTGTVCYGINTGFGAFANRIISREQVSELQYNLVRSHSCGIGEPLAGHIVRRVMLMKANSLAVGYSGIRPDVVETLLALLNKDITPILPSQGSVGASGDLAPLAHLALALIGEGEALQGDTRLAGAEVLDAAGMTPVTLQAKEGLALLNGTQVSAALAIEGLLRAFRLLHASIVTGALTVEGLAGSYAPFDARIHAARGLPGQQRVARQFLSLLTESDIHKSHENCDRVQDPYSVRCMPQVIGAVFDTLNHAANVGRGVQQCFG